MRHLCGLFFLFFLMIPGLCFSQGIPSTVNYSPEEYQNSPQNWAISQDSSGYLYVGNSAGILQFDGQQWRFIHIANDNIVSAIYTSSDDKLFIGGLGEFGYLRPDSLHRMSYVSLSTRLDSSQQEFSYVWNITEHDNKIYFRTQEAIFVLSGEQLYSLQSDYTIGKLKAVGDKLFVWLMGKGLHVIEDGEFVFVELSEKYSDDLLYGILSIDSRQLLCFRKAGLVEFDGESFRTFDGPASDYIIKHGIYRATLINSEQYALATLSGGIIIADMQGNIDHVLSQEEGLRTNGVHGLWVDQESTLWAALDDGIARINVNNSVQKFDEQSGINGTVISVKKFQNELYVSTTKALFVKRSDYSFAKVPVDAQRIYDMEARADHLLLATNKGIYKITATGQKHVAQQPVANIVEDYSQSQVFWSLSSHSVYRIDSQTNEEFLQEVAELKYSLHEMYEKDDYLWILTDSQEVLKLDKQGQVLNTYKLKLNEGSRLHHIGMINNQLSVGTSEGLYTYNLPEDTFQKDDTFPDQDLKSKQVFHFKQCSSAEVWFRADRQIKRGVHKQGSWQVQESPYQPIGESQAIHHITCDGEATWFGGSTGLYYLVDKEWKYQDNFNTNITELLVDGDSLIYGGFDDPRKSLKLLYSENNIRFKYAAASYIYPEKNEYRMRLRGYDNGWGKWTSETEKDYTFIPEGTYTFEVQGRNVYHKTGSIDSFTFTILPPWHRTWWAYSLYLLLIGGVVYGIHRLRINRILSEQRIRNRIASDLHDEVSASLSSITYFAEAIRQVRSREKRTHFVELISESASEAKEKITDIIWSIDPDNDDWVNLLSKCRRFASDLFESKNMDYELHIDTDIDRPLDLELRQHLWLIFKEMAVNAARHSQADKVEVRFGMNNNTLKLVVQDNGIGIDESQENHGGHGIKNIKKRAQQIGADLQLETDAEIGTRWIMTLKIR